ncbi:putative C6 transcription factor [Podospora didyma]|uniref:C6 transcription factor n=1 Tax=Podospora didyma TaxID=330526 RepID=A0AAE0NX06_9PEZI|nr:putative C6 transcription factor [Podospora didyma]
MATMASPPQTQLGSSSSAAGSAAHSEPLTPGTAQSSSAMMPQKRILACVLCQRRKVKCNRKFPCSGCLRAKVPCVPASRAPRQVRRRFTERELLDCIRSHEAILSHNRIAFQPLRKDLQSAASEMEVSTPEHLDHDAGFDSEADERSAERDVSSSSPSVVANTYRGERNYEAKSYWRAMTQGFRDPNDPSYDSDDEELEAAHVHIVNSAWQRSYESSDHLLFGSTPACIDLSTLHPDPVQIFRLWQIYLNNVDPMLKVTHNSTLQNRIIEAIGNLKAIGPALEALMFSIYSIAVFSLEPVECQTMFGLPKEDIAVAYRFGCRQALSNSAFLQTNDRDCLTAFFLHLVSLGKDTHPQSFSAMFGVLIRIAQRMGIHSEATLAQHPPVEAEVRRRLWWTIVMFDHRVGEMSDYKTATLLLPTWDCKIPLNVADSELRPELSELPAPAARFSPTEAIFTVVRAELGDHIRFAEFNLDFTCPVLKPLARDDVGGLGALSQTIEDKYLRLCDPNVPLHYFTIWMARYYLAKNRLVEHYSRQASMRGQPPEVLDKQRDLALSHALDMLTCNAKIRGSPLTARFSWLVHFFFPFASYMHILQDIKTRPLSRQAGQAWEVMNENFEAQSVEAVPARQEAIFQVFCHGLVEAWSVCEAAIIATTAPADGEAAASPSSPPPKPPKLIASIRLALERLAAQQAERQRRQQQQYAQSETSSSRSDQIPPGVAMDSFAAMSAMGSSMPMGMVGGSSSTPGSSGVMDAFLADGSLHGMMWMQQSSDAGGAFGGQPAGSPSDVSGGSGGSQFPFQLDFDQLTMNWGGGMR